MKKLSLKSTLAAFFVIAFLFIFYLGLTTWRNMQQTHVQRTRVEQSLHFLQLTENVFNQLQIYEAAQRGYLFSSANDFAVPLKKASSSFEQLADSILRIRGSIAERTAELQRLGGLCRKRIAFGNRVMALADTAGVLAAANLINQGLGRQLSDSIRSSLLKLEAMDHVVLQQSNNYLEKSVGKTAMRLFFLASLFMLILVLFLYFVWQNFKQIEYATDRLKYQASLIDTIPDAVFTTDADFNILTWNKFAAELYQSPAENSVGKPMSSVFKVLLNDQQRRTELNELQSKQYYKDEYKVQRLDGSVIFILASVNTIVNSSGEVTGYIAAHRDITNRKELEQSQLQFNHELEKQVAIKTAETTNILERITDGFLALNNNFEFTFANKMASEILGFAPGALVGKNIFTDFPDTASKAFNEACLQSFQSQQYGFLENYYAPLNIWIENDIYPSEDGLSVFFKDTTFKKNAELALHESEERYRYLIENIHAGVVVHRPDTSVILFNQEALRLLGLTAEQMSGRAAKDPGWHFLGEDGRRLSPEEYPVSMVIATGKPIKNLVGGIEENGTIGRMWVLVNAFPEFDAAMQLTQVVVTFVDITESKKAAEELKRSEMELNNAQSIARIGSWEFNMQTQHLKWSRELCRIYEIDAHTPADQLYNIYRSRYLPEDLPKLDAVIKGAIDHKKGYTYQHRILSRDGTIKHILGIGEVILDDQQAVIGLKGTGQDITDMVRTDEKLQDSFKQIKQLVTHLQDIREQERTSIAREIHDELGQQLTGLKMYISWLNKKIASEEKDIKDKFSAAIELIEETIKSVRKISTNLRPSMLDDLGLLAALEWQSNEFERRFGIHTRFVNLVGSRDIPARLKTGLFRIYQESLTNVARHAEAQKVISSLRFEEDKLVLTITDDGIGFTIQNIESKKTLGLFGMKERALEMGGLYEIKSEPGMGTTVSVIVPLMAHS